MIGMSKRRHSGVRLREAVEKLGTEQLGLCMEQKRRGIAKRFKATRRQNITERSNVNMAMAWQGTAKRCYAKEMHRCGWQGQSTE